MLFRPQVQSGTFAAISVMLQECESMPNIFYPYFFPYGQKKYLREVNPPAISMVFLRKTVRKTVSN
jgi:hypothetical protein